MSKQKFYKLPFISYSMDLFNFQKELRELDLELFTLNDAVKIMGSSKEVVKSTLSRWVKQKKIRRLKKNYYSLYDIESKYQLQKLFQNTYVGLQSALEFYESTTQRFNNVDLVSRNYLQDQEINSTFINFHKVTGKLFFGFKKEKIKNTTFFISSKEKTIIDCVYFSSKVYLSEVNDFIKKNKNDLNIQLLQEYLQKINSSTLNKRAGYLLELHGIYIRNLQIDAKVIKLNKNISKEGIINKKWNVLINEALE